MSCSKAPAAAARVALSKLTLQAGEPSGMITNANFESRVNNGYPGGCATFIKQNQISVINTEYTEYVPCPKIKLIN